MTRSIYALALSSILALTCAVSISNIASAAAPGGGAPGGAAAAPGGAPGGGAGARGGRGGAGGAGGGAGAFGGGAGGGAGAFGGAGGIGGGRGGGRGAGGAPAGPPAPVPPEVAIQRPTADELAKLNADLKSFISTSPDKDLLTKYSSLISITPPRDINPCIRPTPRQAGRHDAFVATAKAGGIDILFEGDSITDWWTQDAAKKAMFDKYFGSSKVANFAIAGDTTQGVLWGLQNGEARNTDGTPVPIKPKAIMIMIGTNNMGCSSPAEIAEGIGAIVLENRKDFPDAKIMLLGIFPRGQTANDQNRARIAECNKIIAKLDDKQHVFYMDIGDKFLDPATKAFLPDTFQTDYLHPATKGYDIWGAAVADTLKSWAK